MIKSPLSPAVSDKYFNEYFDVIVHTKELLIIQTHSGMSSQNIAEVQEAVTKNLEKVSQQNESFGHFNLGLHVSDDPKKVLSNRAQLLGLINQYLKMSTKLKVDSIHWLNQIHSNNVQRVSDGSRLGGLSLTAPSADALVTNKPNTALAIMTADCVPIVIYDKSSKQVAIIHAGWQGLANGVIAKTYDEILSKHYNVVQDSSSSSLMHAWIGACISQPCYEVSKDVVDKLLFGCKTIGMDAKLIAQRVIGLHENANKAWLDLPALAALQLQFKGIKVNTYSDAKLKELTSQKQSSMQFAYACSYADNRYYSYRRMTHLGQKHTGRMAMIVVRLK